MRLILVAAFSLLGACAARGPALPSADPPSPDEIACRAEARNSPELRRIAARRFGPINEAVDRDMEIAERRLYRECMLRRGAIDGGGVEAVRRR